MSLSSVPNPFEQEVAEAAAEVAKIADGAPTYEVRLSTLPDFEGKTVKYTAAKITSVSGLEVDDAVWRVDQYVRLEVECRVVGIDHKVNEKSGDLVRVHLLKAVDSKVLPWDA